MAKHRGWAPALAGLVCSVIAVAAYGETDVQDKARRLEALRAQIAGIRQDLAEDRAREDTLSQELGRLERRVGEAAAALEALDRRIAEQRARVERLESERAARSRRLTDQRRFLARQIRAAYESGREEYLRLLLNQQDPNRLDRVLVYYDYLNEARGRRIREAVTALQSLRRLGERVRAELAQLQSLRGERAERVARLESAQAQRRAVLERVRARMGSKDETLARLKADEAELAELVQRLQQALADIPEQAAPGESFKASKGALAWPLKGELLAHYGGPRSSEMRWSGVLIQAATGAEVAAVAGGRVVFADWLRGLGLLLIIEHGDGYLTLYGHNQSLYKEVGDWVHAGEAIASVGASGGRSRSALYFEIRADGEPVDPLAWLRARKRQG